MLEISVSLQNTRGTVNFYQSWRQRDWLKRNWYKDPRVSNPSLIRAYHWQSIDIQRRHKWISSSASYKFHLTVCSYHLTYVFWSESTLYSCQVRELLAQNRRTVSGLSDCNWIQSHNYLIFIWKVNHLAKLAKWLSCAVSTCL